MRIKNLFKKNTSDSVNSGSSIITGLGIVITLLFFLGITGGIIFTQQTNDFERFFEGANLLELMDDARLQELTFTRDETSESVSSMLSITENIIFKAQELESIANDNLYKEHLSQLILTVTRYKELFINYMELRNLGNQERIEMVEAAVRASASTNALQRLQERYIRQDNETVQNQRQTMKTSSDNSENSYDLALRTEQIHSYIKNFLLTNNRNEIRSASNETETLEIILNTLKLNIDNLHSIELLEEILADQSELLSLIRAIESDPASDTSYSLNSPEIRSVDLTLSNMRDSALALHNNERQALDIVQNTIENTQETLSRRLALSEDVNKLLIEVANARQSDRDFSLATTNDQKTTSADRVYAYLSEANNLTVNIQNLLIEEDEKEVFKSVQPNITLYHNNFTDASEIILESQQAEIDMIEAALEADRLLNLSQQIRLESIRTVEHYAKLLIPLGLAFTFTILFLAILMRKSQQTLVSMTKSMQTSKIKAEAADNAKSSFLAVMSHEIRTPMNGVVGMIELLGQTKLDADQAKMIATVRSSSFTLLHIINDILDFSKIEAGHLDLEQTSVSIRDIVEEVADTISASSNLSQKEGVFISTFIDPAIPYWILGDHFRLNQVLYNLLGNAIKFTDDYAGTDVEIKLHAELIESNQNTPDSVQLSIIDNGIGISEQAISKLFKPFSQAESSTTRRFGGTGLGLSICKHLVELMNGNISVQSIEGEGSTFSITIPIKESLTPALQDEPDLEGTHILLVGHRESFYNACSHYINGKNGYFESIEELFDVEKTLLNSSANARPFNLIIFSSEYTQDMLFSIIKILRNNKTIEKSKYLLLTSDRSAIEITNPDIFIINSMPLRRSIFLQTIGTICGKEFIEAPNKQQNLTSPITQTSLDENTQEYLIMLTEDNPVNQDVIKRQLHLLGYAVDIFENGELGLAAWKTGKYEVILTDCHMPIMDGYQMTSIIRKIEKQMGHSYRTPIIAITADALRGMPQLCINSGMDDYLSKPMEIASLKNTLTKWLPDTKKNHPATIPAPITSTTVQSQPNEILEPIFLQKTFANDKGLINSILEDYIISTTQIQKEINSAYIKQDMIEIVSSAHKLKSSSSYVGANKLASICEKLETSGKNKDWETVIRTHQEFNTMIQLVFSRINDLK